MNKRVLFILGVIVFFSLITGCEKSKETGQPSGDGYEIRDIKMGINDSGQFSVIGKLKNKGGKKGYTEILIPCYDKNDTELGNASDSTENIAAGDDWEFRAVYSGNETPAKCEAEKAEVTTY